MVSTSAILAHFDDPDALAHYGVKGMKWGVRKQRKAYDKVGRQLQESTDNKISRDDLEYRTRLAGGTTFENAPKPIVGLGNAETRRKIFESAAENAMKEAQSSVRDTRRMLKGVTDKRDRIAIVDQHVQEVREILLEQLYVESTKHQASTYGFKLEDYDLVTETNSEGMTNILALTRKPKQVKHSDSPDVLVRYKCTTDKDGLIVGLKLMADTEASHDAISSDFLDDFLVHYGVKGMKWGVRRDLKRMNPKDRPAYIEKKDAKWVQDTLTNHKKSAKVVKRTIRDTKIDNLSTELRYKEQGYKFGPNVLNKSNIKNRRNRAALNSFNQELDSNYKNNLDRHLNKTFGQSPTRLKEARIEPIAGGVGYRVHIVESDNPKLAKQFSKIANKDKKREAKAKRIIEKEKKKKLSEARKLKHSEVDLDSLMHHGVKGMKWGVRKDRQKRGVRKGKIADPKKTDNAGRVSSADAAKVIARSTAKGAKKVSDIVRNSKAYRRTLGAEDEANRIRRDAVANAARAVDTYKQHREIHGRDRSMNKRYRNMSDEDMRRAINRLKLEREYDTLIADRRKQNRGAAGKIADWGKDTTKSIATDVVKKQFKNLGDEILSEALGIDNKSREEKKKKKNNQS